jgi:hypothetical protein
MSKKLTPDDIVGHRLHQILQTYELLEEEVDFALNYFILDSGIAFLLPASCDAAFESSKVPISAEPICHPRLSKALNSTIARVAYRSGAEPWESDTVCLQMETGVWLHQETAAPQGVGGAGLLIEEVCLFESVTDYWDRRQPIILPPPSPSP